MLFAERPPPTKPGESGKHELRIPYPPELLDEIEYRRERLLRPPVVRRDGDVATELQDRSFFSRRQTRFL